MKFNVGDIVCITVDRPSGANSVTGCKNVVGRIGMINPDCDDYLVKTINSYSDGWWWKEDQLRLATYEDIKREFINLLVTNGNGDKTKKKVVFETYLVERATGEWTVIYQGDDVDKASDLAWEYNLNHYGTEIMDEIDSYSDLGDESIKPDEKYYADFYERYLEEEEEE